MRRPGAVVVLSSHVARGGVGNRAMVFALERLGFTVWAAPTVLLPHHPGHGAATRIVPADGSFAALVAELTGGGRAAEVAAIVSGYLASAGQVDAVAALVRAVKAERPDALYLCDPVIGDVGGLYVAAPIAAAIRDVLLPLADIITPNAFECAWLAGAAAKVSGAAEQARALPSPVALVTSAPSLMRGQIGTLLTTPKETILFEHPCLPTAIKGTGDLLAGLLAARRLEGRDWADAAEAAIAGVFGVLAGSIRATANEMLLAELQDAFVTPISPVARRRIGGHRR
jgi:pyridoxine kinase